ncbi:MAG: hypothetical protein R3244_11580, partial [Thermoanaerobaculia bacterium]|nr:hypothetical protein [Thermoanaerobaculia bacterium]
SRRRGGDESTEPPDREQRPVTEPVALARLDACLTRAEEVARITVKDEDLIVLRHAALLLEASPGLEAASANPLLSRGWTARRIGRRVDELLEDRDRPRDEAGARLFLFRAGSAWPIVVAFETWRASKRERRAWERLLEPLAKLARRQGRAIFDPPPLLRGDEIAHRLGIEPGPELGRVVDRLRRLQITGRLRTAQAARDWLAGRYGDLPPPQVRE